jgi:hypothetical protein
MTKGTTQSVIRSGTLQAVLLGILTRIHSLSPVNTIEAIEWCFRTEQIVIFCLDADRWLYDNFVRVLVVLSLLTSSVLAQNGAVRGTVVDARGGEPLGNVAVQLALTDLRTQSDRTGKFTLPDVPPGDYVLSIATVGYHAVKRPFHLDAAESKDFEIVLSADNLRRTDHVDVSAGPFETARQDSPGTLTLSGNDVKNLGSVLADDPLRAVQSLPGVSSNNDFDARFSVRGADYSRIGLYLDDILLHEPFHMVAGQTVTGSGAAFNGDMVEDMELHESAFPQRFGDRSAGILDVHTREGQRSGISFRAEASFSNAGILAEGPLGRKKRGSWLVGARKSYLQYLVSRLASNNSTLVFGIEDTQARFTYDLTPRNNLSFYLLESYSTIDRSSTPNLGINSLKTGAYNYTLANLGWRSTPTDKLAIVTRAAWMREKFDNNNPSAQLLGDGFYGEWVANTNGSWSWNKAGAFDFGGSVRRLRDEGLSAQFQSSTAPPRFLDHFNGSGVLAGAYAEQSWTGFSGVVHLTASVRGDHHSLDGVSTMTPQVSAAFILTPSTRVQFGWGQYAQFPEISLLTSPLGGRRLLPARSNHALAALEQRFGSRTRLRLELYNRADRDLTFQPFFDPRIVNGAVFIPPVSPLYLNSLRGYGRGAEIFLQRSSANRFTGWVSYSYGHAEMRDGVSGSRFPSDSDQKHSANIYGSYRLRPSVNLSLKSSYGSGFPIPGYVSQNAAGVYFLAPQRSQFRVPYYQRTDVRINKAWTRDKWKFTLYGEVVNLTNRTNYVFESVNGYNTKTGQTSVTLDSMFPILPSIGVLFER